MMKYTYRAIPIDGQGIDPGTNFVFGNVVEEQETGLCYIVDLGRYTGKTPLEEVMIRVKSETICRCTNIHDNKERAIFENDIVNTKKGIGIINYDVGCFCIQDIHSKNNPAIDIVLNESEIEVIGNIFDNPELLEVG